MKIAINEATAKQLAEFASTNMGLDVNYRMGVDKIRGSMSAAGYSQEFIEVEPDAPLPTQRIAIGQTVADEDRKMVRIIISQQDGPGGKEPVVVGVNGRVARIERGKEVSVPAEYIEALKNANKLVYEKGPNGEPINPSYVPTHPFTILQGA